MMIVPIARRSYQVAVDCNQVPKAKRQRPRHWETRLAHSDVGSGGYRLSAQRSNGRRVH